MNKKRFLHRLSELTGITIEDDKVAVFEAFAELNRLGRFDLKFTQKMIVFILGVLYEVLGQTPTDEKQDIFADNPGLKDLLEEHQKKNAQNKVPTQVSESIPVSLKGEGTPSDASAVIAITLPEEKVGDDEPVIKEERSKRTPKQK